LFSMSNPEQPKLLLFSQHGMSDTKHAMNLLAHKVSPPQSHIIAPNLGVVETYFAISPLIEKVERASEKAFEQYPNTPIRIIATSLGGVIWVEVLSRNPDLWPKIESLVLLGVPIGGAALARIIDPFGWGIGMAKHLGKNRRTIAEQITAVVPTLVVAGNTIGGGDGTVTTESTKLKYAHFVCLNGVNHPDLRNHPAVAKVIREFWSKSRKPLLAPKITLTSNLIEHFRAVTGITDANTRAFHHATTVFSFVDGTNIRTWKNHFGVDYVFIGNANGKCQYAGFVGWVHSTGLERSIDTAIKLFRDSQYNNI
jgi:pimeloyl-ACP methyl ester carboxylesterase